MAEKIKKQIYGEKRIKNRLGEKTRSGLEPAHETLDEKKKTNRPVYGSKSGQKTVQGSEKK
jgi:hypothetical protein